MSRACCERTFKSALGQGSLASRSFDPALVAVTEIVASPHPRLVNSAESAAKSGRATLLAELRSSAGMSTVDFDSGVAELTEKVAGSFAGCKTSVKRSGHCIHRKK
jgi:hypothetical protein